MSLLRIPPIDGQPAQYQFSDFSRGTPLLVFGLLFVAAVILVARWRGLAALVGLGVAGVIAVLFLFPALVAGTNPVLVGLIASAAIVFVALFAAHGLNVSTTTALVGSLAALLLIAALGAIATSWAHLTGIATEGDYAFVAATPDLRLSSVLTCGVILASIGLLIDVTTTQATAVWKLAETERSTRRLFERALRTGREHATAILPTIAFVVAGVTLPALLLLVVYDRPLLEALQTEQFADDILRIFVASTGVVLAIPLTTAIGVLLVRFSRARTRPRKPTSKAPVEAESASTASRSSRWRRGRDFEDIDFSDLREPADERADRTRRPPARS